MHCRLIALFVFAALAPAQDWKPLFDGASLAGWRETAFTNHGKASVIEGQIVLAPGRPMTGITWAGEFPKTNYEIRFEAVRRKGNDFFASLTFPVGESHCTWIAGGWGGDIAGLSSLEDMTAAENETRTYFNFENNRWYRFRLQVTPARITAWIDDERIIQVDIAGRYISLRPGEIELSAPLGFASYATEGGLRKVEYRLLSQ